MEPVAFPVTRWIQYGLAVLLLAAFGMGLGWIRERDNRLREEGQRELLQERYDSLRAVAEHSQSALEAVMVQENPIIAAAVARADSAEARADRAERRRPAVIERVVERAGPDSAVVRIAVEEVRDSMVTHELNPLRGALFSEREAHAGTARKLDAALRANYDLQGAIAALEGVADRRRPPSWWERHDEEVVGVLAAVAAVAVDRKLGGRAPPVDQRQLSVRVQTW